MALSGWIAAAVGFVALWWLAPSSAPLDEANALSGGKYDERRSMGTGNVTVDDSLAGLWARDAVARALRLGAVRPTVVSWNPRIIYFEKFLSEAECEFLVGLARPRMAASTVVDIATGQGVQSTVRTSSGTFLTTQDRELPTIQNIERRIATFSMVPEENGELLQILRYEREQEYMPHHDWFSDQFNLKRGGQRVATLLMYLSSPEEGGETIFPSAGQGTCKCGGEEKQGVCVEAKKGNAVLFWSQGLSGQTDYGSLHGGCRVLKGIKWSATKWMRQSVFE